MTVGELVEMAKLGESPDIEWFDYAVPINADGTYPFNGRAVSIMSKRVGFEIVPYRVLAEMALEQAKGKNARWRLESLIKEMDGMGE